MKKIVLLLALAAFCSPLLVSQAGAKTVKLHKAHKAHHHVRHHAASHIKQA
jgi:hypothetical protein